MPEKTAFGGSYHYRDFKAEGVRIGVETDTDQLKKWMLKLKGDEPIAVQHAAADCHAVSDVNSLMFEPYADDLIRVIKKNIHEAGPRLAFRLFATTPIKGKHEGEVIDLAFKALYSLASPIVVKVHSMTAIANSLVEYPDLANELGALLEAGMKTGSAAYKSRARQIAKKHNLKIS